MDKRKKYTHFEVKIISRRAGEDSRGFTLIELLVVIAIIAVLMAILMRALIRVKEPGNGGVFFINLNQLGLGWFFYAD